MTKVSFETATDAKRDEGIEQEGTYHMVIMNMDCFPTDSNGQQMQSWSVRCGVLQGTVQDSKRRCVYVGCTQFVFLNNPRLDMNDQGEFSRKVQTRFLLVTGLTTEEQLGSNIAFDPDDAVGRQFIAKFRWNTFNNKTRMQVDRLDFFHVDSALVDAVPKDKAMIDQIAPELRWSDSQKVADAKDRKKKEVYSEQVSSDGKPAGDIADIVNAPTEGPAAVASVATESPTATPTTPAPTEVQQSLIEKSGGMYDDI